MRIVSLLFFLGFLAAIPAPGPQDVAAFLRDLNLEEYMVTFASEDVDLYLLRELTEDSLRTLGVRTLGLELESSKGTLNKPSRKF